MDLTLEKLITDIETCDSVTECARISDDVARALGIKRPDRFIDTVLGSSVPPAKKGKLAKLFDDDFETGTFFLSERLKQPDFIASADNLPFKEWVFRCVHNEICRLCEAEENASLLLKDKEQEFGVKVEVFVFLSMFLKHDKLNKMLVELVPNQLYQDVFTKLIAFFMYEDANKYPYVERSYNEKVEAVSLAIIEQFYDVSLLDLLKYSIAAGSLGVDMKSSASAASPIHKSINNIIFYNLFENETFQEKIVRIKNSLDKKVSESFVIDFWKEFETEFVFAKSPKTLLWFHDDVAETVFDLFFIQQLLSANENLKIISVPRSGKHGIRYGNDASSIDIKRYLSLPVFSKLSTQFDSGQYGYSECGPCWGAVHGLQLSEEVVDLVLDASAILVKGSRSYEMLQGIKVPAYFASMVCRDFSESVFDIDAELGSSIFIKQEAGLSSFQGFKFRNRRSRKLPSGRSIMLCLMTAKEYAYAVHHENYKKIVQRFEKQLDANLWIKNEAKKLGITIAEFILSYKGSC